ncbi:MAG TPA: type II toxin-antitoxin system RelE/ParE family toxin [Chitinophagaceae bacterium]|nr:type II toxin-antitoxin system RelE/ParE family toxin [Chitinophagaceae bacterium]
MAEVIWSPRAIKDISEIAEYIAKDSLQYAEIQTRLFISKISTLESILLLAGWSRNWE